MPIDLSPGSFAAVTISALFWWTVLSPLALLAVAVLCGRRPGLRGALMLVVLSPPVVTLLPVAVMHGGREAVAAGVAAATLLGAIALAVAALVRRADAGRGERAATAALLTGVAGGMVGSFALVGALLFS
ncbi:MAG TPA: hypothetical protein VMH50_03230 [Thermoleophilia bacterium]|nr:hypothetical protein [Thermoleophilia bacterium]